MRKLQENDFWAEIGSLKQENLFFNVYPELIESVSEVRMDKVVCPGCKDKTLDAWIYKQSGDWLQEKVLPICGDCQKVALAKKLGNSISAKHQKVIDKDWYLIRDTDDAGFKNFEASSTETVAAKTKAVSYTKAILADETMNLRISGTTGTGKTHLAKAIARTLKHEGKNVAFIGANELFSNIKSMFGNDHAQKRFDEHFQGFEVVIIDDVGVETSKKNEISWSSSEWVRLIDLREGKSTVYTTNFDEESLAGVIGARAESRMSQNSESIKLYTPDKDYRKLEVDDKKLFY